MPKELSVFEKVTFIEDYFKINSTHTPSNIARIYNDPKVNEREVSMLYNFLKMDVVNLLNSESALLCHILSVNHSSETPNDDDIKGFLTAIQWLGTNVGCEFLDKIK